jgi:aminoglycoside 6'-N-acetyltransferase
MNTAALLQPGVWSQIGIAGSDDGTLIGDVGLLLSSDGRQATVGFTLRREWQGRGMATLAVLEAIDLVFEETAASRVIAVTDARNVRSIRLLERIGMEKAGWRAAFFRGEACIECTYVLWKEREG